MSDYEPRMVDPRISSLGGAGSEARGSALPCFDCGQSDHGMHDPRCHVEQLRQGHRMEIQMLQRELQLLRERNAAVPPQHHHRYAAGTTNITVHQYAGAPPLPASLFDRRSTPLSPVAPRAISHRSSSLPAPVAASPPGSSIRSPRRRQPYRRGPAMTNRSPGPSPPCVRQSESPGLLRRGPSSWTWIRNQDRADSAAEAPSSGSAGEVCLVQIPWQKSGPVSLKESERAVEKSSVVKVESVVGGDGEQ